MIHFFPQTSMNLPSVGKAVYRYALLPLLFVAAKIFAFRDEKVRQSLEGRDGVWERLNLGMRDRDLKKPLVLFHVASAGEYLQAQPLIERLVKHGYQYAITVTSITGKKWVSKPTPHWDPPLFSDFLPLDFLGNIKKFLAILQPDLIVYVKFDLWPNLVWEAQERGIPQYLISATLQPKSTRLTSPMGRLIYKEVYAALQGIYTVSNEDKARFQQTNPDHSHIQTYGDTRFDSVLDRKKRVPTPQLPPSLREKFVFIIGSSWPEDERCVFPALQKALERFDDLFLIITPHEPTEEHLAHGESYFQSYPMVRLSGVEQRFDDKTRVLMVDSVGVLSSLYRIGRLAYVGGAFTTGVHNTMEPCAMGLPVIFGPKHYNSPEALELLQKELAFTVKTPEEFEHVLFNLLETPEHCDQLGRKASKYVHTECGAADRCFDAMIKEKHEN